MDIIPGAQSYRGDCLLADVVHELVISTRDVHFGDDSGLESVHQLAEDDAVTERNLVGHWREPFTDDAFDPLLGFCFFLGLPLAGTL